MEKIFWVLLSIFITIISSCKSETKNEPEVKPLDIQELALLEEVPSNLVCMVNNNFMGIDQIKVDVEGKTYYGCCADCEVKLKKDENQRFAIDPVTNEKVDKATAIIGKLKNNKVLYFSSKENFEKYGK